MNPDYSPTKQSYGPIARQIKKNNDIINNLEKKLNDKLKISN